MLLACGDALIDFLPDVSKDGKLAFVPHVGGSCLNVAVTMARLGAPAGYVGAVSKDFLGDMIVDHASMSKVDAALIQRLPYPSTAAFVRLDQGEPQYLFYDDETAARHWVPDLGASELLASSVVHFGSTTLIHEDLAARSMQLLRAVKPHAKISFDPNCRPHLVHNKSAYQATIEDFARNSDVIKMSDVDFEFLYGRREYGPKAAQLLSAGVSLVCITRGDKSTLGYFADADVVEIPVGQVKVHDTVGAGDTFMGALLVGLYEGRFLGPSSAVQLRKHDVERLVRFATNCAGITCGRAGADPPFKLDIPGEWWPNPVSP